MTDTEILFLGTGDAFNTDGLANQSILFRTGDCCFLVDAGPSCLCRMIRLKIKPETLSFIFITHFHGDHTAGLPFIILYLKKIAHSTVFPVVMGPEGTRECVIALFESMYKGSDLDKGLEFHEYPRRFSAHIGSGDDPDNKLSFEVCPINHNPESIGYRFHLGNKIIAVSGDTGLDDALLSLADNCDAVIIECSTEKAELPHHISAEELEKNIGKINAKLVIPIHSSIKIREKLMRLRDKKILIVTDNKKIRI